MKKCVSILVGVLAVIAAAGRPPFSSRSTASASRTTKTQTTLKTEKGEAFASPFSVFF